MEFNEILQQNVNFISINTNISPEINYIVTKTLLKESMVGKKIYTFCIAPPMKTIESVKSVVQSGVKINNY